MMNNNVEGNKTRSSFFPKSKINRTRIKQALLPRNNEARKAELNKISAKDSKVNIPEAVKDFSRIKKVVDNSPAPDNTSKIEALKKQIQNGTYNVNYDELADKILKEQF